MAAFVCSPLGIHVSKLHFQGQTLRRAKRSDLRKILASENDLSVEGGIDERDSSKAPDVKDKKLSTSPRKALERAAAYKKMKASAAGGFQKLDSGGEDFCNLLDANQVQLSVESASDSSVIPSEVDASKPMRHLVKFSATSGYAEVPALQLESVGLDSDGGDSGVAEASSVMEQPAKESVKVTSAFEKAKAYSKQQAQGEMLDSLLERKDEDLEKSGIEQKLIEVEIYTREGIIKRKVSPETSFATVTERKKAGVSSIDFAGLSFSDKKIGGKPAGLREAFELPPPGELPQVEIITRDGGKSQPELQSQDTDFYRPQVSTWGVFPRPSNISKSYGGGRNIRPGENLETDEERTVREARTRQLLADYKRKLGLDTDPKIKAKCEEVMRRGEVMMESGQLREALGTFEVVMRDMTFQSKLHGLAALQTAVCLDSLSRYDEAKGLYEKLVSHPNQGVRKQARRFLFGFQAMEILKVADASKWDSSSYRKYFDGFSDGFNTLYRASGEEKDDSIFEDTWPYAVLLFFPCFLILVLAALRSSR